MHLVTQSCPTLCDPMYYSPPGSSVHGDSPGKNTGVGCHNLLQGFPNPGIEPRSPTVQVNSLPSEPPGKTTRRRYWLLNIQQKFYMHYFIWFYLIYLILLSLSSSFPFFLLFLFQQQIPLSPQNIFPLCTQHNKHVLPFVLKQMASFPYLALFAAFEVCK